MAKVTITIEDAPGGKVKVVAEPNFETMMQKHVSGNGLTAAQGYALAALNSIRMAAKSQSNNLKVIIPRLR